MSELDKEYTPDASETPEEIEAFEDFEIAAEEAAASVEETEAAEEAEPIEETEAAEEAELIEEAEAAEEAEPIEEAEAAEEDEPVEETEAAEEFEPVEEAEAAEEDEFVEEAEAVEEDEVSDEIFELYGNNDEVEEIGNASAAYAALNAVSDSEETEVEEEDYLDYDDSPRPKKLVSGKTAVITMLVTAFVTIGIIVTAACLAFTMQKDMNITVVSFSDNFNACDTKNFTLGSFIGVELVSMSDEDCTLSEKDISDLKHGKTVTKFNDLVNITADTRFGKIVSMDIEFEKALDKLDQPGGQYILLLGNVMSGFKKDTHNSDEAFLLAYQIFNNRLRAEEKGEYFNVSYLDGKAVYFDYAKINETELFSDLSIHIENMDSKIVDINKLDFSWLPFDFSSKKDADSQQNNAGNVSQSDK